MTHVAPLTMQQRLLPNLFQAAALASLLVLSGCGGGGGGDDNAPSAGGGGANITDNIPTTTSLPEVNGLTGDASASYRLFYVSGVDATPGLYAYKPGDAAAALIDKDLSLLSASAGTFPLAVHTATVSSGTVTNYRIDKVVYSRNQYITVPGQSQPTVLPGTMQRIDVDAGTPQQISGSSVGMGAVSPVSMVSFDLADSNNTLAVFPASDEWQQLRVGTGSTTPISLFKEDFILQRPIHNTLTGQPSGWLVIDKSQADCLARVNLSDLSVASCIANVDGGGPVPIRYDNATHGITGGYSLNNGKLLALPLENTDGSLMVQSELWFYHDGTPGTLERVENASGEPLQTSSMAMLGLGNFGTAVSKDGETLYLASGDGGIGSILGGAAPSDPFNMEFHTYLFKVTTAPGNLGWQQLFHQGGKLLEDKAAILGGFLADAGDRFIWSINDELKTISLNGQNEVLLDGRDNDGGGLLSGVFTTSVGDPSAAGWFFYNRENNSVKYATAIKVDGSKRVELANCEWIGASTSGHASFVGGSFANMKPSEVFMFCDQKTLAAVEANDPEKGRVLLGSLPASAKDIEVQMGRTAPGPHRLLRVMYGSSVDYEIEVVYVNTRQKNSLKHLMSQKADDDVDSLAGVTAPVNGF